MKKSLFIVSVLLSISAISFAQSLPLPQPILKTGWTRVNIINVGFFDIPESMEVQKGKYKESMDATKRIKGYDVSQLTVQQKGLNDYKKNSFERYARVIVETDFGKKGEFERINFDISVLSQTDINQINNTFKQNIKLGLESANLKLIEWYPIKVEKVNGMSCIHVSYIRQLQDKPNVLVHMYMFQNNDRMHKFTLSYRLSESEYWKTNFATILKSIRITNIRL
jgi:hypothetical protein